MSGWSILVCDVRGEIISLVLLLWDEDVGVLEEDDCFVVTAAALCLFVDDVVKGGMGGTLLLPLPPPPAAVAIVAVGRMTNGLEFTLVAVVGVDCC